VISAIRSQPSDLSQVIIEERREKREERREKREEKERREKREERREKREARRENREERREKREECCETVGVRSSAGDMTEKMKKQKRT
jgi:hypothetical protein